MNVLMIVPLSGGRILGKTTCEDFCGGGNSFTSATGPVLNPRDKTKSAGGSSSGNAVLVRIDNDTQVVKLL